ncbi:histone deacetylase HDT1 isoform X2 [Medicago truncatula]|uniref:histone deacetylase HDT1 isoform X2 n=1 Tax=Medicago truncatula TaxID=3880 RepID=UPI001967EC37|nr:histone deacetylase HDT1 isoform X2 [Medicago truncatula]
MEPLSEFWGVEVKVGQSVKVDPNDLCEGYIHISQVALGEVKKDKASEPVVLYLKVDDQKFVLGTLIKDTIPQIAMDIFLDDESELSHNSKNATVYFSGYKAFRIDNADDFDSDSSDNDPELAPLRKRAQAAKEAAKSGKPIAETGALAKKVKIVDPKTGNIVDPEKYEEISEDEPDSDFYVDDHSISDEIDTDNDENVPEALAKKVAASAINAEINTDNYDTDLSDTDTTDSDGDEETPAKKVEAPQASVLTYIAKNATHENIDTDTSDSDTTDSSDEETPAKKVDQGKNRERSNEALSQTLVLTKKAKIATPVKTDDKKYVHIATPHPMKKGGKTSQNAAKDQTSNSSKSASFKAGQQNNKSKQGRQ